MVRRALEGEHQRWAVRYVSSLLRNLRTPLMVAEYQSQFFYQKSSGVADSGLAGI